MVQLLYWRGGNPVDRSSQPFTTKQALDHNVNTESSFWKFLEVLGVFAANVSNNCYLIFCDQSTNNKTELLQPRNPSAVAYSFTN